MRRKPAGLLFWSLRTDPEWSSLLKQVQSLTEFVGIGKEDQSNLEEEEGQGKRCIEGGSRCTKN